MLKAMDQPADAPMIVRAAGEDGFIRVNAAFRAKVGFSDTELAEKPFLHWIDQGDHALLRATLEDGQGCCRASHRTRCGDLLPLEIQITAQEQGAVVLGRCADTSNPSELVSEGVDEATVLGTLATIAQIVEEQNPGYKCSILLVADGRFVSGAGPSLPDDYNAAIDGYAIGPTVGSCGTAIYWNVPIIVEDIQTDPLWINFAELAKTAGVAACWSYPFTSRSGRVLGALALYAPEPRAPTVEQLSRLKAAARMTGLAVERGLVEEALREKRLRELELEDQLRQASKREALGVLAGGVAHDFNNVLSAILGNAEIALELLPDDAEAAEMMRDIVSASHRAGNFCKQMLAYAGRSTLKPSRTEVGALLSELSDLAQAALSKKASLEYSIHDEPIFVEGDENQLLQVITNLITNAAEAIGDNEGRIVVGAELAHYDADTLSRLDPQADLPGGEYVRLTVADTGCGMNAETVARIFDPFFTTKFTGRGLGLAAVKGTVCAHRGVIQIESKLGEGSTFTVLLPTTDGPERDESMPESPVLDVSRKRVLVVDDEAGLRAVFCRRLKHSGFDVVEAADGQEAVDIFCKDPGSIDCVLLDLKMPKRSGDEVYQDLRALREDVSIVLMSGFTEQEVLTRFDGAKLAGTLQKPFPGKDLIATIRNATA